MKIKQVTEVDITFDNGNCIYFDHDQVDVGSAVRHEEDDSLSKRR